MVRVLPNLKDILIFEADQIKDLGPAPGFWSFTIENYIGVLKGMITSRSNVDKQLGNSIERKELLNLLDIATKTSPTFHPYPRSKTSFPTLRSPFSHERLNKDDILYKSLDAFFGVGADKRRELDVWPIHTSTHQVIKFKRAYIRWRLSVGSAESNKKESDRRRCDSYVRWGIQDAAGRWKYGYGLVLFFCTVQSSDDKKWVEPLAIIQPYQEVTAIEVPPDTVKVIEGLNSTWKVIRIDHILNLIGRSELADGPRGGKSLYLTNTVSISRFIKCLLTKISTGKLQELTRCRRLRH